MKRIAIAVALLLVPASIWGCGGSSDSPSSPATTETQQGPAVVESSSSQPHSSGHSSARPEDSGSTGTLQDHGSSPKGDDSAETASRPPKQGSGDEKESLADKLMEKVVSNDHAHHSPSRGEIAQALSQITKGSGTGESDSSPEHSNGSSSNQGVIDRILEQFHGQAP